MIPDVMNRQAAHFPKVVIVAGEASGDLHGSNLIKSMHQIDPTIRFYGIGGPKMKEAGIEAIADSADMAVVGLTEVIFKIGYLITMMSKMKDLMRRVKPDLLISIDYPDFNIPLAKAAKKKGIEVLYYISPQVWAWRKGRIKTIKRAVNTMAVILPFEEQIYHNENVKVAFVGHPLLDAVKIRYSREEAMKIFGLQDGLTTIAILPGSRRNEVVRLLPEMLKAAEIIKGRFPAVQFILPLADTLDVGFVSSIIKNHPVEIKLINNNIYDVINIADIAVVASGTATLETALLETPMIMVYKVSMMTYFIGRMFIKVPNICLVNIIAGKTIVPELIQDQANPEQIAAEVFDILTQEKRMRDMKMELSKIRDKLGIPGASERAARLAYKIMSKADH